MKTFRQHVSDDPSELIEGLSPADLLAAGVATMTKIKKQLSGMSTPEGKKVALALNSLAKLLTLYEYGATPNNP